MKLALTIQTPEVPAQVPVTLLTGALEQKLAKAASLGADGVEFVTTEPAALNVPDLRALLKQNDLLPAAVASGGMAFAAKLTLLSADASVAERARRKLDELVDLAAALGAPVVTVGSFRGRAVGTQERSLAELADVLRRAGKRAASAGVRIALEPLNRFEGDLLNTVDQGLDFLKFLDTPAVGLLVDTVHVNIEESSWTGPYRRAMAAGRLFHVHLGDNNRLPPGQGLIDFAAILAALHAAGYDGWLSAELLGRPDPDTAARQTVEHIKPLMKALA